MIKKYFQKPFRCTEGLWHIADTEFLIQSTRCSREDCQCQNYGFPSGLIYLVFVSLSLSDGHSPVFARQPTFHVLSGLQWLGTKEEPRNEIGCKYTIYHAQACTSSVCGDWYVDCKTVSIPDKFPHGVIGITD